VIVEVRQDKFLLAADSLPNDVYKRVLNVGHVGMPPYIVQLLDERVIWASSDGNTISLRQFIRGHHDSPLTRNWKRHVGWQGEESIREVTKYKLQTDGLEETKTREIDVSARSYIFDN